MAIITDKTAVLDIYREAALKGWVLPCLCSENQTTTEAILAAAAAFGRRTGIAALPIIIAITNQYAHRSQSVYYSHAGRWEIGLRMFLEDLRLLAGEGAPYGTLRVMVHLDHIQFDADAELLKWDMERFSSIMFDASRLPFGENIRLTRRFVGEQGDKIVIEGACDEIVDAGGNAVGELTTAERAEEYAETTGVDLIVANLGTEHRAAERNLRYRGDIAGSIRDRIGNRIVLHGASSLAGGDLADLFRDGICKVNIWTTLERDSASILLREMVQHASQVGGRTAVQALVDEGYLTRKCLTDEKASLGYFTTEYRQNIIYRAMQSIVTGYLELWYTV